MKSVVGRRLSRCFDCNRLQSIAVDCNRRPSLARFALIGLLLAFGACEASAFTISSKFVSPRNAERAERKATKYLILHTTEGGAAGALAKLRENGEAHYCVDTNGVIYRIIDRKKVALHCGLSMWKGERNIDQCSIGIEIVGTHDKPPTAAQIRALKELLAELKGIYKIKDDAVLTHSMVAYGTPNKWQKKDHRGRKRCGMLFAGTALRAQIGLRSKPAYDPDLRDKRLVDGDPDLTKILYQK